MATVIYDALAPICNALAMQPEVLALMESTNQLTPSELEGKQFMVDATALLTLCKAFQASEALRNKREGATSEATEGDDAAAPEKVPAA